MNSYSRTSILWMPLNKVVPRPRRIVMRWESFFERSWNPLYNLQAGTEEKQALSMHSLNLLLKGVLDNNQGRESM